MRSTISERGETPNHPPNGPPAGPGAAAETWRRPGGRLVTSLAFLGLALVLLPFADLELAGHEPWAELQRMLAGLLAPDFSAAGALGRAALLTLAFAICGVALGAGAGFILACLYRFTLVRFLAVALRSVHELFWAILLLQITGLSATTGLLAIAIPYSGIFAKVFSEYLDEADPRPARAMPPGAGFLSVFFFARLPLCLNEFATYTLYRLECAMRSSAVLGFVGLPTLGFELDTFFKQGMYGAVAAVLLLYYLLIATIRVWMRWPLAPFYLIASVWALMRLNVPPMAEGALIRFLTQDIVPAPLRGSDLADPETWTRFELWISRLVFDQALPGLWSTFIVAQLALVLAGLTALIGFPFLLRAMVGRFGSFAGHIGLVIGRSTPEYMLAYILLQMFGPSMLPAVIALGLHNGAIIAHLLGRQSEGILEDLRADRAKGLNLYFWEILPRIYGNFLALCFYRWEIILRESAIVGLLGMGTLGFYVGAAIQEIRVDRAVFLLLVVMLATIVIDMISRRCRARLGLERLYSGPSLREC